MRAEPSDAELIRASLRDPAAFRGVFGRHHDAVRRYLQRRCGPDAGEELAAQTFEIAFRNRSRFAFEFADARPWLFGIATNLLRHHYRAEAARMRAYEREAAMTAPSPGGGADARAFEQDLGPALLQALRELSAGERDALLLLSWADLSYEGIARALDIPIGTVRSRIHRARRRLRELASEVGARGGEDR